MKLVLALALFLIVSSCNQNKKLEEDLGPKISSDQFEKVLVEAWGDDDIFSIKKEDYAYVVKEVSINGGAMNTSFGKAMTVTHVEDVDGVVKNHIVIQSEEIQTGQQSKMSTRERVLAVKKAAAQSQSLNQKNVEDEIQMTPFEGFLDVLTICRNKAVECFKLKSVDFTETVPDEIKVKNCRMFPSCKWTGKKVTFVIRVTYKDESGETKTQNNIITLKLVREMPYLFKMISYCFEGLSEYQGQKFPVNICTQVKDTIKGQ